jgi:hypothetical protein
VKNIIFEKRSAECLIEHNAGVMYVSEYDAFSHLLDSYSSWLRDVVNGRYQYVDTFEQLMLSFVMETMYDQKWDSENWVKAHEGYESKPGSSLYVGRQY